MFRARLPSLAGLLAFEAAGRNESFTKAAEELNVTQTAISHRIKTLEALLGRQLFHRHGNVVELTAGAQIYLEQIQKALSEISTATASASGDVEPNVLNLHCLGTFAIKRLLLILPEFKALYPELEIQFRTLPSVDPGRTDFDVAIWHGDGRWPGLIAEKLGDEEIFPVCSPKLLIDGPRLEVPSDLSQHTLIKSHSTSAPDEWPVWFKAAGLGEYPPAILMCDHMIMSIQAAIDGLGVLLGRTRLIAHDLQSGRLVEPFRIRARSNYGYYIVTHPRLGNSPKVNAFRSWLLGRIDEN